MKKKPQRSMSQRPFSLLVKPAGADCNLACTYCFYLEKCGLYPQTKVHRMSDETLHRMIGSYMRTRQPSYSFGWQGGEPTLMGLDFFRKVTSYQQELAPPGAQVSNGLQTNGSLIDDEFARHLADYRFLLGVSLDGPEDVHDTYRRLAGGGGSYARVRRGIEALQRHSVEFNILVLVSRANIGRAAEVYRFLRSEGFRYLQFIPCVEFDDSGSLSDFAVTGEEWGRFISEIFDEWYPTDTRKVSIRLFDSVLQFLVNGQYTMCSMGGSCNSYLVVEHSGDIYPCDFYVESELKLGNVHDTELGSVFNKPESVKFARKKTKWAEECASCQFLSFCSGDCPKQREARDDHRSWLCEGWKHFYEHSLPHFRALAHEFGGDVLRGEQLMKQSDPEQACFCGSGKKFKNCHGQEIQDAVPTTR
jgi:uncharacterized protein